MDILVRFYSTARRNNFDVKRIAGIINKEDFCLDEDIDTNKITDIMKTLRDMYHKGWDHKSLQMLDIAAMDVGRKSADIVKDILHYYRDAAFIRDSMKVLNDNRKKLKDDFEAKTEELNSLMAQYEGIYSGIVKDQKQRDDQNTEISDLMENKKFVEYGIDNIYRISTSIDEKLSQLKRIEEEIAHKENTLAEIDADVRGKKK